MTSQPGYNIEDDSVVANNPLLGVLRTFITDTVGRQLSEIYHYDIVQWPEYPSYAEFSVRFGDGSHGYKGTMMQPLNGWRVHTFQAIMTVSGISPTVNEIKEQ